MNATRVRRLAIAARQVARANVRRLSTPLKVNFALTYWCQYRCKTCNIWKRRPEHELTTDEVLRFIERNRRISWLDVTGGEIFLRRDIGEILEAIVTSWDDLVLLHFPTNGFMTDRIVSVCERVVRHRGPEIVVTVSIDGNEIVNDEVRGIRGGYRAQIETFKALRKIRGLRTVFGMTLSAFNVGRFEETLHACQRECPGLKVSDFHVNVAQSSEHYYGNSDSTQFAPSADQARAEVQLYRKMRGLPRSMADWVEAVYLARLDSYLTTRVLPMRCHSLRSSCFVDPWGTVFPCITYTRPLGTLRETDMTLAPIWNAAATRTVQHEIWNGDCPQCWTACEAYQSILGNVVRLNGTPTGIARQPSGIPVQIQRRGPTA